MPRISQSCRWDVRFQCQTLNFRFLLAKLQMEHILSPRSPLTQMKRLKTVPEGLYPPYNSVIERIKNGRDGDEDVAMRIISWIYRAQRTLLMDELLEALVVDEHVQDVSEESMRRRTGCDTRG